MKDKSTRCPICRRPSVFGAWCKGCSSSYDRSRRNDDGTVYAATEWAAGRAWRAAIESRKGKAR